MFSESIVGIMPLILVVFVFFGTINALNLYNRGVMSGKVAFTSVIGFLAAAFIGFEYML